MNSQSFIELAREYVSSHSDMNPTQWEYDGIKPFLNIDSLDDVVAQLSNPNPNVVIQATRILQDCDNDNINYIIESLIPYKSDSRQNKITSNFEFAEDESVSVADQVNLAIGVLNQRKTEYAQKLVGYLAIEDDSDIMLRYEREISSLGSVAVPFLKQFIGTEAEVCCLNKDRGVIYPCSTNYEAARRVLEKIETNESIMVKK
jgi:hypothetical protein